MIWHSGQHGQPVASGMLAYVDIVRTEPGVCHVLCGATGATVPTQ